MDNLTHSLIGIAFARALPKKLRKPEIYLASLIGNNAPDADFIVRFFPGADSLDYLVHHRGYTHTFFLAPVMGLITAFVAKKIAKKPEWEMSLVVVAVLACFMHVGADFLNSYGVHPFTPFSDRWYFGDSLYIVEPLIWFTLLPFVALEADRRWTKRVWWGLAAPMLALVWFFPTFSTLFSACLTGFFIFSASISLAARSSAWRTGACFGLLAVIVAAFVGGGAQARHLARGSWQSLTEGMESWLDTSSSPVPGNPLCWNIWLAAKDTDEYRTRSAVVSLWPSLLATEYCDPLMIKTRTAEVRRSTFPSSARVRWDEESRMSMDEWREFHEKSGTFRRFISFARFPFIKRLPDGGAIFGDLRYDRETGLGFSEVMMSPGETKTTSVGPWTPPFRADR